MSAMMRRGLLGITRGLATSSFPSTVRFFRLEAILASALLGSSSWTGLDLRRLSLSRRCLPTYSRSSFLLSLTLGLSYRRSLLDFRRSPSGERSVINGTGRHLISDEKRSHSLLLVLGFKTRVSKTKLSV